MTETDRGAGVLVVRDGKVLVGRRTSPRGRGTWSAPGGKAEPGETDEGTARRELVEETGLVAAVPPRRRRDGGRVSERRDAADAL